MVNIYWHCRWRGLSSTSLPPILQVQLEAGTHPVTVGFSTVWQSLTTEVPRALTQAACYCVQNPFLRVLHPVQLWFPPYDYLSACTSSLKLISYSSPQIFYTKHYQIPPLLNKINYLMFHFLDPLCLFT